MGDKIRARRKNGSLIEAEIDNLYANQANVFWYERGYLFTKQVKYDSIVKIEPIKILQPITVNQPVTVHQPMTINQHMNANQQIINRNVLNLKIAGNIIFLVCILILLAVIVLIFFSGVFEEYQKSHQVLSKCSITCWFKTQIFI